MVKYHLTREVKRAILNTPGVVSVGEGMDGGERVAIVTLDEEMPADESGIPQYLDGLPVVIEYGSPPQRLSTALPQASPRIRLQNPDERHRPLRPGLSTGNANRESAGTLGFFWTDPDEEDGPVWATSNHHVWVGGFGGEEDDVTQPGPLDGGNPDEDVIGYIDGWRDSDLDAAFSVLDDGVEFNPVPYQLDGLEGVGEVDVGDSIVKSGRTSGVTEGEVVQVNYDTRDQDGNTMHDQIKTDMEVIAGDSGSPVLNDDNEAVAVVWAESGGDGIVCPVSNWEEWSGLEIIVEEESPGPRVLGQLMAAIFSIFAAIIPGR